MAQIARTVQRQIGELVDHYLALNRPKAVENHHTAVAAVLIKIDQPATRSRRFQAACSGLASLGMQWVKQHIYWFGYGRASDGVITITNVIHESANFPARVEPFR